MAFPIRRRSAPASPKPGTPGCATGSGKWWCWKTLTARPATGASPFGSSVFVSAEFAEEAKTTLPPPLAAQVIRRWQEGRSPVLCRNAVREANSGRGLTLLVLCIGWLPRLPAEEVRWAKAKLLDALLFFRLWI